MPERKIISLGYNESALRVCVDGVDGDKLWGRVFSMRLSAPIPFGDLGDFVMKMDQVMDEQNFPQSFQRKREFKAGKKKRGLGQVFKALEGEPLTADVVNAAKGQLATFTVRVLTRQNASWQGHIIWDGEAGVIDFSSELDMVQIVLAKLSGQN